MRIRLRPLKSSKQNCPRRLKVTTGKSALALAAQCSADCYLPQLALYFGMVGITCKAPRDGSESDRCDGFAHKVQPAVVPGVGPVLAIETCEGNAACVALFAADAGLQSLGIYLLISGANSRNVYVRDAAFAVPSPRLTMTAIATPGGAQLSAVGTF